MTSVVLVWMTSTTNSSLLWMTSWNRSRGQRSPIQTETSLNCQNQLQGKKHTAQSEMLLQIIISLLYMISTPSIYLIHVSMHCLNKSQAANALKHYILHWRVHCIEEYNVLHTTDISMAPGQATHCRLTILHYLCRQYTRAGDTL